MSCCVAYMCSNRQVPSTGLSFFRFPMKDKDRLQQWIHNVKRKSWTPNKHSRLCCLHFTQDCFIHGYGRVTLKPDAVPTIFYPHYHVKVRVRRNRVSKNTTVSKTDSARRARKLRNVSHDHDYIGCTPSEQQTVEMNIARSIRSRSADHGAYTLKNTQKRKVSSVESSLPSHEKKLRKLQEQRVRRLKQKVKSLSSVVTDLKEKLDSTKEIKR
ncbi:THAP domain-containing protein 1-like [Etheostoma cragini]|uniref:THAP domain-containing protein 1-like n=1 Tax=Etheostoma cragini TaxID=417921 RepID=UPI00155E4021|nr:THAP domain-containing protein 1-like [Etheostoma cragini]